MTKERGVLYLVAPPRIGEGLELLGEWCVARTGKGGKGKEKEGLKGVEMEDVRRYLEAFYHGMEVKMLDGPGLEFPSDANDEFPLPAPSKTKGKGKPKNPPAKETKAPKTLWLKTGTSTELIGIRTRPTPKNPYPHQLNLNDLLDAAIEILPDDAYALLMLVDHDIYEDDDDDFACGRAYGGSRVAVVSTARYNPVLDPEVEGLEREHAWPASHCGVYVNRCNDAEAEGVATKKKKQLRDGPVYKALEAHQALPSLDEKPSVKVLEGLWLSRVCRTASHELGHCLGIDHCVYYACAMQGTASLAEDARQPPYLCPVDLAKVLRAMGADENERYAALERFCVERKEVKFFAAFGGWVRCRLEEIQADGGGS